MKSWYVPQLDGLRFIAFLMVFLCHAATIGYLEPIRGNLALGVDLFFCLSAFLITRLLLLEYENTKKIRLYSFYIRRSLRIWPLYYLWLIIVFTIIPFFTVGGHWIAEFSSPNYLLALKGWFVPLVFFFENFAALHFGAHLSEILTATLWTISVEEQFYIFWPLFFKIIILSKNAFRSGVLISLFLLSVSLLCRFYYYTQSSGYFVMVVNTFAHLDSFASGIFIAFLFHFKELQPGKYGKWLVALGFLCMLYFFEDSDVFVSPMAVASVWGYALIGLGTALIVAGTCLDNSFLSKILKNKKFVYLGKISFGLYIFHFPLIGFYNTYLFPYVNEWPTPFSILFNILTPLAMTICIGTLSYEFFEKPFLRLKERFSVVRSRPI